MLSTVNPMLIWRYKHLSASTVSYTHQHNSAKSQQCSASESFIDAEL